MIPKYRSLVKACSLLALSATMSAALPVHAELILETAPTLGGSLVRAVLDTESELQWLTPQATKGLSYVDVAHGGYLELGYRYATSGELIGLLGHAGYDTGPLLSDPSNQNWSLLHSDSVALRGLVDILGPTAGDSIVYGILGDLRPFSQNPDLNHALATLSVYAPDISLVIALGPAFPSTDFDTGSFLVREVSAVPELGTALMMAVGVLLFAGTRRRAIPAR